MVLTSSIRGAVSFSKSKSKFTRRSRDFIDKLRIYVRGGAGGQGFNRYGGVGGKGGDIWLEADENTTLESIRRSNPKKRFVGNQGGDSRKHGLLGTPGADIIIPTPLGVSVVLDSGQIIGEMNEPGDRVMVARGGKGGDELTLYAGERGVSRSVSLDLKLIADVGLVGFPNAGKSTLLAAISRAKPKIANYPFTTLKPQIGQIMYEDHRQISMADLPGLIEGAHVNVGMGHHFLKHVERTKLLLFVVDVFGFQLGVDYKKRSALETILLLNKELELYKDSLVLNKPSLLVLNKMDRSGAPQQVDAVMEGLDALRKGANPGLDSDVIPDDVIHFEDVIAISAKTGTSVETVKQRIREIMDFHADNMHRDEYPVRDVSLDVMERSVTKLV